MGSDALYNEQALLWAVIRFVCAVTGMRRPPRPPYWRGAAWVQAQPARAQWARIACRLSLPRLPHSRGAEVPMGSDTFYNKRRLLWEVGTLCLGCNWHKDSPAR